MNSNAAFGSMPMTSEDIIQRLRVFGPLSAATSPLNFAPTAGPGIANHRQAIGAPLAHPRTSVLREHGTDRCDGRGGGSGHWFGRTSITSSVSRANAPLCIAWASGQLVA